MFAKDQQTSRVYSRSDLFRRAVLISACAYTPPKFTTWRGWCTSNCSAQAARSMWGASVWMWSCWSGNIECEQKSDAPRFCCLFRNTRGNSDISVGIFVSPSDGPSIFCTLKPTWVVLLTHGWTAWVSGGMYQALWQEALFPFFSFSFQLENVQILI